MSLGRRPSSPAGVAPSREAGPDPPLIRTGSRDTIPLGQE